ncbi:MAG TPA: hypothetical protein VIF60_06655 [Burkholderiaceae bacterium]
MNTETTDSKQLLRDWIAKHAREGVNAGILADDTPILEQRIISSLQVMELILFIEKTAGRPVNVTQLKAGSFRSIDTIHDTFFASALHE